MENYIEKLPRSIMFDGNEYFLRIKKRKGGKPWNIRYLGKKEPSKYKLKFSFKTKVRGFTYKTFYEEYGRTLETLAQKVYKHLEKENLLTP